MCGLCGVMAAPAECPTDAVSCFHARRGAIANLVHVHEISKQRACAGSPGCNGSNHTYSITQTLLRQWQQRRRQEAQLAPLIGARFLPIWCPCPWTQRRPRTPREALQRAAGTRKCAAAAETHPPQPATAGRTQRPPGLPLRQSAQAMPQSKTSNSKLVAHDTCSLAGHDGFALACSKPQQCLTPCDALCRTKALTLGSQ